MSVSPHDMLIFNAVAREGGIRTGAEALKIPRSTVSRQLARLERALGGRLVSRSTRRFTLTDLGRSLLEQGARLEEVLRATEAIAARTTREPSGLLRVAASHVVGEEFLPGVVAEYLTRFPQMKLDIELSVDFVDLRKAGVDLAVRTGPLQDAGDLYAARLGTSLKGVYASAGYLKRRGIPADPLALTEHDCIVIGEHRAAWSFRTRDSEVRVPVSGCLHVDSYSLARSAAAKGVGIAHLPSIFAQQLVASGDLIPILETSWQRTTLYAVHAAGLPPPPKIRAFIELLRATIGQRVDR